MHDDMVERVAKAIQLRADERGYMIQRTVVRHLAAAAIEAMREPTDQMLLVTGRSSSLARQVWRAMIKEALVTPALPEAQKAE